MTDRKLLTGHDALLLRQIARDLFTHCHINMITNGMAFGEPVVGSWLGHTKGFKMVLGASLLTTQN